MLMWQEERKDSNADVAKIEKKIVMLMWQEERKDSNADVARIEKR